MYGLPDGARLRRRERRPSVTRQTPPFMDTKRLTAAGAMKQWRTAAVAPATTVSGGAGVRTGRVDAMSSRGGVALRLGQRSDGARGSEERDCEDTNNPVQRQQIRGMRTRAGAETGQYRQAKGRTGGAKVAGSERTWRCSYGVMKVPADAGARTAIARVPGSQAWSYRSERLARPSGTGVEHTIRAPAF